MKDFLKIFGTKDKSATTFRVFKYEKSHSSPMYGPDIFLNKKKLIPAKYVDMDIIPIFGDKINEQPFVHTRAEDFPQFKRNGCTKILQKSQFPPKSRLVGNNGLINTVVTCYCRHHNLVIRPDDIWTAIMTQFSFYINANAEKFRDKFVHHEREKELVINIPGNLQSANYKLFVKLMSEKIGENLVDPKVKSWILPNFSTTTDNDLVSCGVVFMAAMKNYFNYTCGVMCGIPFITLEGTLADWENILERIDKLKEYELEEWAELLKHILQQFVSAKKGEIDKEFWQQICKYGLYGYGEPVISGWITAFATFNDDGRVTNYLRFHQKENPLWLPGFELYKIPTSIVDVDVKIVDNGNIYFSSMLAGHMGFEILDSGTTLKPMIGWVIALKASPEEMEEKEKL